jgi:hypothetical protein
MFCMDETRMKKMRGSADNRKETTKVWTCCLSAYTLLLLANMLPMSVGLQVIACPSARLPTSLAACNPAYMIACLSVCLPDFIFHASLSVYLPACLLFFKPVYCLSVFYIDIILK